MLASDHAFDYARRMSALPSRVLLRALALVPIAVLQIAMCVLAYWPAPRVAWGDELFYGKAATELVATGRLQLPLLWPPLYAHFLASLRALGGASILTHLVQLGMLGATALLLGDIARHLFRSERTRWLTIALTLGYPPLVAFTSYQWPEILHGTLFAWILWILVCRIDARVWTVALGILLGLAVLTKSLLMPLIPIALAIPVIRGRRAALVPTLLACLALAGTVAPTILYNARVHGAPVIAESGLFNLWVGLNDRSRRNFVGEIVSREYFTYLDSAPTFLERQAVLRHKIWTYAQEHGVLTILRAQLGRQYFRLFHRDSFLTDQLPGGTLHAWGLGYRAPPGWLVTPLRVWSYASYTLLLLLTPLGLALFAETAHEARARWTVRLALGFIGYNLALFLVLHVKTRYRIPLLPIAFLFSAYALDQLAGRLRRDAGGNAHRLRVSTLVAGGSASAALLLLAYAPQ